MKIMTIGAITAVALCVSTGAMAQTAEMCNKWRFLLEADHGDVSAFLVGEIDTSKASTRKFSEITDTIGLVESPEPTLSLDVTLPSERGGQVDYTVEAVFPGPGEDTQTTYYFSESELLRDGYIAMTHKESATFTLFGQKLACSQEVL